MKALLLAGLALFVVTGAHAQNAAGVFGPIVNPQTKWAEYRLSVAEPTDELTPWVQRVHWEQGLNERFSYRLGAQFRDRSDQTGPELDFARVMLFWEAGKPTKSWTTGFRFDARTRNGGRPDDVAVSWTNQWDLNPDTFVRFNVMAFQQVGDNGADHPIMETRSAVLRRLGGGKSVSLELYNVFGELSEFGTWDEQRHELAPTFNLPIYNGYYLWTSLAVGLSDAVPDETIRFRIGKRF